MTDSWSGLHNAATESGVEGFTNQNRLITDVYKRWNADPKHSITNAWFIETGKMPSEKSIGAITDYMEAWKKHNEDTSTIPQMPFSKTWPELLLKRMMKYASDNNYSGISWTPGEEQASRYDLSKQVDKIVVIPTEEGSRAVRIHTPTAGESIKLMVDKDGKVAPAFSSGNEFAGKHIADVVGKEVAEKIMSAPKETHLTGVDLKVGGEGMKGFYDKIIPDAANKLGKQWGAKVGETKINTGRPTSGEGWEQTKMWDQLRSDGRRGQMPLYAIFDRGGNWVGTTGDPSSVDDSGGEETAVKVIDEKGNLLKDAKLPSTQKSVPYLPITPQMRAGVKSIPYSLFSIPLAAGALTLQQVKAQGDELQKKFKPTGVTK